MIIMTIPTFVLQSTGTHTKESKYQYMTIGITQVAQGMRNDYFSKTHKFV